MQNSINKILTTDLDFLTKPNYESHPYCNTVLVKLPKSEVVKMPRRAKVEYIE
jgi:hypothetical protein